MISHRLQFLKVPARNDNQILNRKLKSEYLICCHVVDAASSMASAELVEPVIKRPRISMSAAVGGLDQLLNLRVLNLSSNQLTGEFLYTPKPFTQSSDSDSVICERQHFIAPQAESRLVLAS